MLGSGFYRFSIQIWMSMCLGTCVIHVFIFIFIFKLYLLVSEPGNLESLPWIYSWSHSAQLCLFQRLDAHGQWDFIRMRIPPLRDKANRCETSIQPGVNMSDRARSFTFLTGQFFCWLLTTSPLAIGASGTCIFGFLQRHHRIAHPLAKSITKLSWPLSQAVCLHHFARNPLEIPAVLPQSCNIDLHSSLHEGRRNAMDRVEQGPCIRHRIDRNRRLARTSCDERSVHRLRQHASQKVRWIFCSIQWSGLCCKGRSQHPLMPVGLPLQHWATCWWSQCFGCSRHDHKSPLRLVVWGIAKSRVTKGYQNHIWWIHRLDANACICRHLDIAEDLVDLVEVVAGQVIHALL